MTLRIVITNYFDTDDGTFELTFKPDFHHDVKVEVRGNRAVIGYLMIDETPSDPMENDGMGKIYSSQRDRRNDHGPMQSALGLDRDWEPDLELVEDAAWEQIVEAEIRRYQELLSPGSEIQRIDWTTYQVHYRGRNGRSYTFDFDTDQDNEELAYRGQHTVFTEQQMNQARQKAWQDGRADGTIGDRYAVLLDVYQHGSTHYSVSGEGMQCIWDTARGGAIWTPDDDKDLLQLIESEGGMAKAIEIARVVAEEYTNYINGEVYGVVVKIFERANEESPWESAADNNSCWGFIGATYANEQLAEEMKDAWSAWEKRDAATG